MLVLKWRGLVGVYLSLALAVVAGRVGLGLGIAATCAYLIWFEGAFTAIEAAKMREGRRNPAVARQIAAEARAERILESASGTAAFYIFAMIALIIFWAILPDL